MKQATGRVKSTSHLFLVGFLICLPFNPEDRQYIPLKHQRTTKGIHDETSLKRALLTVIAVRTSISTKTAYFCMYIIVLDQQRVFTDMSKAVSLKNQDVG